jgi:transposase
MVVVADAGMLSASNLKDLDEAGFGFIVGSRAVMAPLDLACHFRWHGDAFTDGQIIDTLTPKHGNGKRDNDVMRKAEPIWDPATHTGSWRAVWAYSQKRFARDNKTLTFQENRARDVIAGDKPIRSTRFVKTKGDARSLDETALARARKAAGLKGYVTNIPATTMAASQIITSYHALWQIEQSFRMSKTDLQARPLFARSKDAIEAHLTIVFTALAISRTVQNRSGLAIRRVLRQLRPLRSASIAINGVIQEFPPAINDENRTLIDSITRH